MMNLPKTKAEVVKLLIDYLRVARPEDNYSVNDLSPSDCDDVFWLFTQGLLAGLEEAAKLCEEQASYYDHCYDHIEPEDAARSCKLKIEAKAIRTQRNDTETTPKAEEGEK